jgi:hypothetical protein
MTKSERDEFASRAERVYAERLKHVLEPDHFGKLIAVEPDSGDYVLGKDFWELDAACQPKFGTKLVHIFRVGGGAAVKIGGPIRHARLPG